MNKVRYIWVLCLLLCGMSVSAQTYERVWRNNFWNGSGNVSGIRQDSVSVSYAEFYGGYEGGEFRDYWQAAEGWKAGAETASIRHLERMSLAGSFSFRQDEGYGMCGSMFISPGYYPVDLLEFTPGRKTKQTYAFDGGISYDVTSNWRIGARMDFESVNFSKRKDLRHSNWGLDMTIAPGFTYCSGEFAAGASALFRKTSETVSSEQVGTAESSYYAFLDKGMMYGTYGVWTGSGLHLSEAGVNGFPVREFSYGASAQMQYKDFFAEAGYLSTTGSIGEKEYIWFRFPGNEVSAKLGYKMGGAGHREHFMRLGFDWKSRVLSESVLEKITENGVTTVLYHGSNQISSTSDWSLSPEYEYVSERWEFAIEADLGQDFTLSSQIYPYLYSQSLFRWELKTSALVHIKKTDLRLSASFADGDVKEDMKMVSEWSGVQTTPFRLEDWYNLQMEYRTAEHLRAFISIRQWLGQGLYVEASGEIHRGFGLSHITGPNRFSATMKIGYSF